MRLPTLLATALVASSSPGVEPASAPPAVRILWQEARWASIAGPTELSEGTDSVFVISGELQNAGPSPVESVKVVYELLDEMHAVVASEYGYNHAAEDLRSPEYERGEVKREGLDVRPLAPGAIDLFRMVFFRNEVPRFARWRVRVTEARPSP